MEASVQDIVDEVVRRLREQRRVREARQTSATALVIFTGSWGTAATAARQIRSLSERGIAVRVLASPGAARVLDIPYLAQQTGCRDIAEAALVEDPFQAVADAGILVLPTLTQNTAVKIALGIRDTMTTELAALALLAGKPVVACDENIPLWSADLAGLGCEEPSPAYMELIANHRRQLERLGVRLISAGRLAAEVMAALNHDQKHVQSHDQSHDQNHHDQNRTPDHVPDIRRRRPARGRATGGGKRRGVLAHRVITERDVLAALVAGLTRLEAPVGTLITPLARDTARQRGLALVESTSPVMMPLS